LCPLRCELALLPRARALLRRVADLGLQVVLASSAPDDELEMLLKVLDCDDIVAATTSSRDVDTAKPEPGIVLVALDRAVRDYRPCRVRRRLKWRSPAPPSGTGFGVEHPPQDWLFKRRTGCSRRAPAIRSSMCCTA